MFPLILQPGSLATHIFACRFSTKLSDNISETFSEPSFSDTGTVNATQVPAEVMANVILCIFKACVRAHDNGALCVLPKLFNRDKMVVIFPNTT